MKAIQNILFFAVTTFLSMDCQCPPLDTSIEGFEKARERVQSVFLGNVVSRDTVASIYVIEVSEVMKGELRVGQRVIGKNSLTCNPYIDRTGLWLFFGKYDVEFIAEDCGHTFYIDDPRVFPPPAPPPPETNTRREEAESQRKKWRQDSAIKGQEVLEYFRKE